MPLAVSVAPVRQLCAIAAALLLSACAPDSSEDILEDYLYRVENASGIASTMPQTLKLLPYPSRRHRNLPVQEIRIGLLDFFDYADCDLTGLIAERNSNLGRVMPPSRRLVYEIRFLQGLEHCYTRLGTETDPEFKVGLKEILTIKRANLPGVFWNASFDSDEMEKVFSLAGASWDPADEAAYTNSRQAIEYLTGLGGRLFDPDLVVPIAELESHLQSLQLHRYGGRLLTELALLSHYLNAAASTLEAVMAGRPICYQGKPSPKARIMRTVLIKFYGGRVQPRLAKAHRQGREWLLALEALTQAQAVALPDAFSHYRQHMLSMVHEDAPWSRFLAAIQRHTEAWQAVLRSCGLMPGQRE